jgi:hypothetical protein
MIETRANLLFEVLSQPQPKFQPLLLGDIRHDNQLRVIGA